MFKKISIEKNIDATFHTLRHTYATNCIGTYIDVKTVSKILCHSDINIPLNLYHTSFEFKKKQINRIKLRNKP
ncbi:site-specific integrase [Thomasclavelia ramosa]|uniref:tyrosine-type recombinase/integrase n=1 Tax=Thomasclavelia ramosa TaxID=1547 RepID=UPI000E4E0FDC|nr:site-specific integrase [Thomasclavelia ramosa]